jgi:hypothetical protein
MARRGGVKRLTGTIYEETRSVLKLFLENTIKDAVTFTEHGRRKTITAIDVVLALKKAGRTLYGFGFDSQLAHRKMYNQPKPHLNVICYTLFGRTMNVLVQGHANVQHRVMEYVLGLYHNCLAISEHLPGWHVRLYLAQNLYDGHETTFRRIMKKIVGVLDITVVQKQHVDGDYSPTLWRVLPFFEAGVNVALFATWTTYS